MNTALKFLLVAAVGTCLCGCEKKQEPAAANSNNSAAPAQQGASGGNPAPAAPAAPAAPQWTQASSEGALRLFLGAMAEGRFADAAVLVDQGSESYEDFVKLNEMFDPATANPRVPKNQLEMLKGMFSSPWKDATVVRVSEEAPRAEYAVTLNNGREKKIELNLFQDNWYILATKSLLAPGTPDDAPEPSESPSSGH